MNNPYDITNRVHLALEQAGIRHEWTGSIVNVTLRGETFTAVSEDGDWIALLRADGSYVLRGQRWESAVYVLRQLDSEIGPAAAEAVPGILDRLSTAGFTVETRNLRFPGGRETECYAARRGDLLLRLALSPVRRDWLAFWVTPRSGSGRYLGDCLTPDDVLAAIGLFAVDVAHPEAA
ncbi:hypothetical protein [Azospirillum argentinense]|uniref:hypothetical protein n=1 Tax=Azospirillum argentinense TaxID=2970906 RepID=UPI0032DFFCB1